VSFTGDASQVPISNIVQALFLSGQEGILTVNDGAKRRNLRLLKLGIRPLASSPTDPDLLRYALIKEKLLTEAEFQNALSTWDPKTKYPGDFLVRRRLISPEQVENNVRRQLEEIIFDVFSSHNLRYEFFAGADWQDHEIFQAEGLGQSLIYSVNGVLMESVRREDDWRRIHQLIRSEFAVFTPTGRSLPSRRPQGVEIADAIYDSIHRLISGDRTVQQIIADSPFSPYEVNHLIFQLVSTQLIRELTSTEKEQLAEKLRRMLKTTETLGLYQSILADQPERIDVRLQLIALLERLKQDPELLLDQYTVAANQLEKNDPEQAASLYEKILLLDPSRISAYEKQIFCFFLVSRRDSALSAVRSLAKESKAVGRQSIGLESLMRIHQKYPQEPIVIQEIADLLVSCGNRELAIEYLKTLASLYDRCGDTAKFRRTSQLIVNLTPSDTGVLGRALAPSERRPTFARFLKAAGITAAAIALLSVGLFLGFSEFSSRTVWADVERSVCARIATTQYAEALRAIDEFEQAYPYSSKRKYADTLREGVRTAETESRQLRNAEIEKLRMRVISDLGKAKSFVEREDYVQAASVIASVRKELPAGPTPEAVKTPLARLFEVESEIRKYFTDSERIGERIEESKRRGDVATAHALTLELLDRFPASPLAKSARVPVLVHAKPDTSSVYVDSKLASSRTPAVLDFDPRTPATLQISHAGYTPRAFRINPLESAVVAVQLDKIALWTQTASGPIDAYPVSLGPDVIVPTRNGSVICIADGRAKWEFSVPDKADITGGLGIWNNLVYAACFDGNIYLIDGTTGQIHGTPILATKKSLWIKEAPSDPSAAGIIVVNCANRTLAGINLATASREWTFSPFSTLIGPPQSVGKFVFAYTASGELLKIEHDTGATHPSIDLQGKPSFHGSIAEGNAYVVLDHHVVQALSLSTETVLWRKILDTRITAPPTVSSDAESVVVAIDSREIICFEAKTGSQRWRAPSVGPIESTGIIFGNSLYVGTTTGQIVRQDLSSGEIKWTYETKGARDDPPRGIHCRGIVHKGTLIQGSDDSQIYSLLID
jgi:outer membrane protein assembly factor BamB/tetratricopeptide (TPR) repeat protein